MLSSNQCGSSLVQTINTPLLIVWSMLRRFNNPRAYKQFIKSCTMHSGDGGIGSIHGVIVVLGLPARTSTERLDELNDDQHVMAFSIIGGDHRLVNYQSTTTLHEDERESAGGGGGGGGRKTVVIESFTVDIPVGSSKEDTCLFADVIIGRNLKSLASISENASSPSFAPTTPTTPLLSPTNPSSPTTVFTNNAIIAAQRRKSPSKLNFADTTAKVSASFTDATRRSPVTPLPSNSSLLFPSLPIEKLAHLSLSLCNQPTIIEGSKFTTTSPDLRSCRRTTTSSGGGR
ncbi:Abscisic acid receptor PYL6 [Camellia lanceoleosa]|uniref:Abscisic acid receptor PYL6 n=1 Tax=Camellia lanceoleosa TaxID=1840588 RepID=A0ACC0GEG8_9ERIC|nr:Abscisic acid receptor PYL6 [Camellia lanceoleosa]